MTLMFVGMTFSSCTKDYTCTCTIVADGIDDVVTTMSYPDSKKSDAEDACDVLDVGTVGTTTTTCVLTDD